MDAPPIGPPNMMAGATVRPIAKPDKRRRTSTRCITDHRATRTEDNGKGADTLSKVTLPGLSGSELWPQHAPDVVRQPRL